LPLHCHPRPAVSNRLGSTPSGGDGPVSVLVAVITTGDRDRNAPSTAAGSITLGGGGVLSVHATVHAQSVKVAELVLEYFKALAWPTVVLAAVLMFRHRLHDLLGRLKGERGRLHSKKETM
jgi:hypothetical protein